MYLLRVRGNNLLGPKLSPGGLGYVSYTDSILGAANFILPPVIAVLENGPRCRKSIVKACDRRFHLSERSVDMMLEKYRQYTREFQRGHEKCFEIDPERVGKAPWMRFLIGGVACAVEEVG